MLNRIIQFSLQNRLMILVFSFLLLIGGLFVAWRMEVDVFPDLNAPTVVVMTEAQGMAPEEVERLVTFPIETCVNGSTGVRRVRSQSTTGFSVVWIEFDWGTDIYIARQIVAEKLSGISESFPPSAGRPTLGPQSSILGEVMIVGITADSTSMQDLRTLADWTIRPRLLSIGGVAQVAVIGGEIKEYQILLNPAKMRQYGVSLDDVLSVTENMNQNATGGILYEYGNEYIIRGVLSTNKIEDIGKSVIKNIENQPIVLSDIAEIRIGNKSPKLGVASEKGKPAVLVTITKQPNTNTLELSEHLDKAVAEIKSNAPADVKLSTDIFRQSRFIENSINNIMRAIGEGSIFVVIILFLFLMNFRTTLISLLALPLSLLATVLALSWMGLTINTMSLGGMAIAIGSLVDDAIIDVENVFRRLRENHHLEKSLRQPVLKVIFDASKEIRASIVNATLITIVAFIPLFFLSGMEGRMLRPLGISFIVSLFASMVVAVTLTPVLCSFLLTNDKTLSKYEREPWLSRNLKKGYQVALEKALKFRKTILFSSIVLLAIALVGFSSLGRSFLPNFNEGSMTLSLSTLPGISLDESDKLFGMAEKELLSIPEVLTTARKTGRAELDEHALGVNVSEIEAPFELKKRSTEELFEEVRQKLSTIKGLNFEIGQPIGHRIDHMLSGTRANIAIKIFGSDLNKLHQLALQVQSNIQGIEGLVDLNVEQQVERPQLQIKPHYEMLAKYGIPITEFSEWISTALQGQVVSQVYEGSQVFDLTVKVSDENRANIDAIRNLLIDIPQAGGSSKVPLSYVADVVSSSGPNTINRENVQRKTVVSCNVSGRDLRGVVNDIRSSVEKNISVPEGYHIEYGGQFESEAAASRILFFTSILSLLVIFLLLFQEFKTLKLSGIIMLNLPLALIGGIASIWIGSKVLSIPAIIGFISLFGIATRNGILLVSHFEHLRKKGVPLYESIIKGSLDRLNPILMTALCAALALIPLALNGDLPGNEIQSPMAQVILGGLLSSTLLNGFLIPIVYWMISRKKGTGDE